MNGNPLPPIDAPPADGSIFIVLVAIMVGAILAFVLLAGKMEAEREDRMQIGRRAIEQKKEEIIQSLIDAAPGGRKPWQYDPEERKSLARQKSGDPGE